MGPSGAPLEPSSGHLRPWNLRGAPPGALLGPFGRPRGPLLGPSWALWEPSWAHLVPPWTPLGAIYGRLRAIWNPLGTPRAEERELLEIIRKNYSFFQHFWPPESRREASWRSLKPSWKHLATSERPQEQSWPVLEASYTSSWPSEAVRRAAEDHFEPIWSPKRGAGIPGTDGPNREPGGVGPCKTGKPQPDKTLA